MNMARKLIVTAIATVLLLSVVAPAFADTIIIQPNGAEGKDAFVRKAEPNSNFGAGEDLRLGIYRNTDDEHRVLIQFDLREIPLGSVVDSAALSLHHFTEENGYYYLTLDAHRVTEDWSETEVTWNNQPSFDPIAESSNFFDRYHPSPDWHEWDLANLAQSWIDGVYSNYGVSINVGQPSQGYSLKLAHSSDYLGDPSLRPKLLVDYVPASSLTTLDYMIAFVERSREKGLIDDNDVAESLTEKLIAASEKLAEGKEGTAENILGAFVNSIEAQRGKHIDTEVADSLVNSARYVIDSLMN